MRSGEAPCDQELADEIRRGRRRKKEEEEGRRRREKEEGGRRRSRASDIKSNNRHLAGGEKCRLSLSRHF